MSAIENIAQPLGMEVVKPIWLQHAPGTLPYSFVALPSHPVDAVGAGGRKSGQDSSIFCCSVFAHSGDGIVRLATGGLDCSIRIWSVGDAAQLSGMHLLSVMNRHTGMIDSDVAQMNGFSCPHICCPL